MSPLQLKSFLDASRNIPLKFHKKQVSNRWDIADIEFVWVGGGGGVYKVILMSNHAYVMLGWVEVELGFWQYLDTRNAEYICRCGGVKDIQ